MFFVVTWSCLLREALFCIKRRLRVFHLIRKWDCNICLFTCFSPCIKFLGDSDCAWEHSITINLSVDVFLWEGWWTDNFHWIPFHERELVGERRGRTEWLMWVYLNVYVNCICSSNHDILVRATMAGGPGLRSRKWDKYPWDAILGLDSFTSGCSTSLFHHFQFPWIQT